MQDPLVSICIPAKNPDFLNVSIRSVIGQTYGNIEIMVSDQTTTDDIANICHQYPEVQYHRLPITTTDSSLDLRNIAHAIELSNGPFVGLLNASQVLHPFAVERLIEPLLEDDGIGLSFGMHRRIDASNQMGEIYQTLRAKSSTKLRGDKVLQQIIRGAHNFVGDSNMVFIRRSIISITSGEMDFFGEKVGCNVPLALCILGAAKGNIVYIPQVMSYFRFQEELTVESQLRQWRQAMEGIFRSTVMNEQEQYQAVKRYLKKCSISKAFAEDVEWGRRMLQDLSDST